MIFSIPFIKTFNLSKYMIKFSSSLLALTLLSVTIYCNTMCCDINTFSVVGVGKVKVDPDLAVFTITVQGEKPTSLSALSFVNSQIARANEILSFFGIPTSNRTTSSINLRPLYRYDKGTAILIGQQASSSLKVSIGTIQQNPSILGKMIQPLSKISNLTISGFSFQNQNDANAYKLARRDAVKDAQNKANQYVNLSRKKLTSIKKIVDLNRERYIPFFLNSNEYAFQSQILPVPYGQVEVNAYVQIDWNL